MERIPVSFQKRAMDRYCNCDVHNVHLSHSNPYLQRTAVQFLQKCSRYFFNTFPTRYDLTQANVTTNQLHKVPVSYAMLLHVTALHSDHIQGLTIFIYLYSVYGKSSSINWQNTHTHTHIYIYIEREREREWATKN